MTKCLLVDDSKVIRKVARKMLEELGFSDIHEAEDGQVALNFCQVNIPDFILLDWNMPVMDGMTFFKEFSNLDGASSCKVMFCTTENDISKIQQAIMQGASEYIMKPFDVEILRSKLSAIGLLDEV